MDEKRTIISDLKKITQAVPRNRLLLYAAILVLVPAAIVWVALSRGGDEAREMAALPAGEQAAAPTAPAAAPTKQTKGSTTSTGGSTAPSVEWRHVTSPDGKFQVDLPSGTKLTQSEGYTYVMPDPASSGATPYMAIKVPTGVDRQNYKPDPATSVIIDQGLNVYWLFTWQGKTWQPFSRIVGSFKIL